MRVPDTAAQNISSANLMHFADQKTSPADIIQAISGINTQEFDNNLRRLYDEEKITSSLSSQELHDFRNFIDNNKDAVLSQVQSSIERVGKQDAHLLSSSNPKDLQTFFNIMATHMPEGSKEIVGEIIQKLETKNKLFPCTNMELLINGGLPDDLRTAKIESIIGYQLNEEEKQEMLSIHRLGKGILLDDTQMIQNKTRRVKKLLDAIHQRQPHPDKSFDPIQTTDYLIRSGLCGTLDHIKTFLDSKLVTISQKLSQTKNISNVLNKSAAIAGVLTPVGSLSQAIEVWSANAASGVSATTRAAFLVGSILWILYGLKNQDKPIIISNTLRCLIEGVIVTGIIMK